MFQLTIGLLTFLFPALTPLASTRICYLHKTNSGFCCLETFWCESLESFGLFSPFHLKKYIYISIYIDRYEVLVIFHEDFRLNDQFSVVTSRVFSHRWNQQLLESEYLPWTPALHQPWCLPTGHWEDAVLHSSSLVMSLQKACKVCLAHIEAKGLGQERRKSITYCTLSGSVPSVFNRPLLYSDLKWCLASPSNRACVCL